MQHTLALRGTHRFLLGLLPVCLLSMTAPMVAPDSASAATSSSTLCSGYASCSRGAFTTHDYQAHSGSTFWGMYAGNNCTNYVAFVEADTFGVGTPQYRLGDGGDWARSARLHGDLVDRVPTVGAVAEWNGGNPGIPFPGHVAIVERVGPNRSYIEISQQNILDADGYDWVRIYRDSSRNQWEQWPDNFIHFAGGPGMLVDGVHFGMSSRPVRAFQSAAGSLVTVAPGGLRGWRVGMKAGTSPSITALRGGGYEVAFQSLRGQLLAIGSRSVGLRRTGIRVGTSPSIAAVLGGYEIALQSTSGSVVTVGTSGSRNWHVRMRAGTSPSITPVFGGGYEVAFQTYAGNLETVGSLGVHVWHLGMRSGTSPSITSLFGGGFEAVVQTGAGDLLARGSLGSRIWHLGMRLRTSPSIMPLFGGGYEVAIQSNAGYLATVGTVGARTWHLRMRVNTSPSITPTFGGGYQISIQSDTGSLITVGSSIRRVWRIGMKAGTSPGTPH